VQKVEVLQGEIEHLRKQLAAIIEEREAARRDRA
jgi:hypothetical protein